MPKKNPTPEVRHNFPQFSKLFGQIFPFTCATKRQTVPKRIRSITRANSRDIGALSVLIVTGKNVKDKIANRAACWEDQAKRNLGGRERRHCRHLGAPMSAFMSAPPCPRCGFYVTSRASRIMSIFSSSSTYRVPTRCAASRSFADRLRGRFRMKHAGE